MDEMKSGQNQMGMLLSVNALTYAPPIDGSLVNNRQYKEYNFQPLSYTGLSGSPQMIVNSGSDYVYGPTSYIRMKVTSSLDTTSFASSAYDLFREFEIDHRSGDLIDRTRNVNALVQSLLEYQEGKGYADGYAQVFGKGAAGATLQNGVDVILPLSWFSGVFSQRALIPASLIAGAKIKLQWEKLASAVVDSAGSPVITVSNMSLVLDSFELMDSARKALLQQQANVKTQGLQFSYSSWDNTNRSFDTTGFDLDVNLSAAKTMIVLAKTRLTDEFKQTQDSMSAEAYPYEGGDWRLRLGSETQPQHQVTTSAEAYVLTQNAFQNIHCDDVNVRKNAHVLKDFTAYKANSVIAVNMEKSQILSMSGRPTNNSRLINLNGTFKDPSSRQMDVWVQILKVANVMVDNVVVDK